MKRQLSNTIYGLKFAMEKNDFERLHRKKFLVPVYKESTILPS